MPSPILRRLALATLTVALLVAPGGGAVAVDEPLAAADRYSPPSLELALASLYADSTPAATPGAIAAAGDDAWSTAKLRLPACEIKDIPTRFGKVKHWKRTLLDTNLTLKRSYQPWDLVSVSRAGISGSGKVRKIMIDDLRALADAARRAGKPLAVRSAHRTYAYQAALFSSYVRRSGYAQAIKFSARPGHSEHQLGTTVDFTTAAGVPLRTSFGASPSGKWLARNGWKYGFIMSYPEGKKKVSCYGYEPWHWRYFGRALARKIHESGQVPRRYLYENFEARP